MSGTNRDLTPVTQDDVEGLEGAIAHLLDDVQELSSKRRQFKEQYLKRMHEHHGKCLVLPYESVDEDGDPDYNDDLADTLEDIYKAVTEAMDLITDTLPEAVAIAMAEHRHGNVTLLLTKVGG